jgi:hypothetical protein
MARARKQAAPATPAPFTADQVAALNAGNANAAQIAKVLTGHRRPARLATPKGTAPAPIPLTEAQVRQITSGKGTPEDFAAALDKAAPRAGRAPKPAKSPKPDKAPPGY